MTSRHNNRSNSSSHHRGQPQTQKQSNPQSAYDLTPSDDDDSSISTTLEVDYSDPREVLDVLIRAFVYDRDEGLEQEAVAIHVEEADPPHDQTEYWIEVPEEDRGKIIGSDGILLNAMRTLWGALASKHQTSIHLEIDE